MFTFVVWKYIHNCPARSGNTYFEKMFNPRKIISLLAIITAVILLSGGCSKDDTSYNNTSYTLMVKDVLGVSGTVTFTETSNNSTIIDVSLLNAPAGTHPANLYMSSAIETGLVVKILNPIEGSGNSSTVVDIPYGTLIAYDGCVKVIKSESESNVILAQGDIGGNVISTTNKSFTLSTIGTFGVTGTAKFEKRANGNTLVTVDLDGTISGDTYPATINLGSIESVGGGPVKKTLINVNGTTGKSYTNISKLDNGTVITYDNWLVYDGYINIYQESVAGGIIICNGNIGSN